MSKPLAAFYGYKKVNHPQQPKPQEYTVLGVNQPLIAPGQENNSHSSLPNATPMDGGRRGLLISILFGRWE